MKNEQLYKETVDIILDAYNNKKLKHTDACGCFIGNIVAGRMGYTKDFIPAWLYVVSPIAARHLDICGWYAFAMMTTEEFLAYGDLQVESTGYTHDEVTRMEKAFENENWSYNPETCTSEADYTGIRGMKAALKVLAEIHETKEDESIERLDKIYNEKYAQCAV